MGKYFTWRIQRIQRIRPFAWLMVVMSITITCTQQEKGPATPSEQQSHQIHTNEKALEAGPAHPSLKAPEVRLAGLDGESFTLSGQKGTVVVLNFWATNCGPCLREMPDFAELDRELSGRGVLFVGIASWFDKVPSIRKVVEEKGVKYLQLQDDGSFYDSYGPMPVPTTLIINSRGELAHIITGSTTKELLKPLLTELAAL